LNVESNLAGFTRLRIANRSRVVFAAVRLRQKAAGRITHLRPCVPGTLDGSQIGGP